ncbi:MAG: Leucine-rich repeat (LRR) protein, partial [Marinoscillum sp.]
LTTMTLRGSAGEELILPIYSSIYYYNNQFTFPTTSFAVTQVDLAVRGGSIDAFEIGDTGGSGLTIPFLSDRYTNIGPDFINVDIQYTGVADYIILERSVDSLTYVTVDTVAFTGWHLDFVTQGKYYYRAKAVYESFGVTSEYSNVLATGNCEPTLPSNKIWKGVSSAPDNQYGGLDAQRDEVYITSPFYSYFEISDVTAGWYDQFFDFWEERGEIRQRCDRFPGRGFSYTGDFDATYSNDTLRINWYDGSNDITGFSKFWAIGDQPVEVASLVVPSGMQAFLVGSGKIDLGWQGQNDQYIVQRSKGNSFQYVNIDTVSTNFFADVNTLDNSYYYYRVLSYNGELVSLPSNETYLIHKAAFFEPVQNTVTTDITRTSYGGSWGDFDGDGDDDLYVTNAFDQPANFLYENTGNGTFKKIIGSIATSEEAFTRSAAWGDYDNDGFLDLLVPTRDVAGDRIYHNTGSKSFEIAATEVTTATDNIPSESGIWVDLDNDGFLDIVNSNGMVFTNDGSGGFTLTQQLENQFGVLAELPILIWTVSNVDIDNDRDQDLYFTSDAYNMLFLNDGAGVMTYTENLISNPSLRARGFSWADFNNDGNIDLLTGDRTQDMFGLYLNDGNLAFEFFAPDDFVTESSIPVSSYFIGRGYSVADFDNDGNVDIIGMLNSRARIFYNNGNAEFRMLEIEDQAFPQTNQFSHISLADFNGDGAMDIFLPNQEFTGANYMYRNNGNTNNWLTVQLKGIQSNRTAIGARVRVKANNKWQSQTVRSLNGISSGNSLALEFGLGLATIADSVEVLWPSGLITNQKDVPSNRILAIVEVPQAGGPTVNQADSAALVAIYNKNGGANWTRKQGWLTGSPLGWEGVNFNSDGRVISLILNSNNLSDTIASQITTLTALQVLDFSSNKLKGPLPRALGNLTALVNLTLNDNQLDGTIPSSVGTLVNLENLDLYNNKFFGELPKDLGKLLKIKQFEIHNNGFIGFVPAEIGTLKTLAVLRLDNNDFEGPLPIGLGGMTNLQVLYINDNHFTESLPVGLGSLSKLLEFKAQNNEFVGALPTSLSNLKELQFVDISNNQFTGSIAPLALAPYLYYFNGNKNRFTILTDLSKSISDSLLVRNNSLDFGAFELNDRLIKDKRLFISPQDSLFERVDSLHRVGEEIEIFYSVGGSFNTYKWLFNGAPLEAATGIEIFGNSLVLTNPDTPNQGTYVLEITNSNYPGVTLRTFPFNLKLSSLERDKQALLAFAAAVNKGAFPITLNWNASSALTSDWDGVTVAGDRVTELVLPAVIDTDLSDGDQSQIFEGDVPLSFADLSGLVSLNLKDHFLRSFPNISNWPSITSADISNNRLAFKDIIPNVKLGSKVTYIPQRRYDVTTYDTIQAGDDKILRINMSGTGLQYQWFFGKYIAGQLFNNTVDSIIGANSRVYQIENVDFDKMGTYRVVMTHPSVPGLTITSRNKNILARTDVFGTVYADGSNTLLDDGEVILYRKTPEGPFVAEDTALVDGGGEYAFTNVVLGDFLALVNPNRVAFPNTIVTYFEKAEFFADATTIEVRNRVEGIDVEMIFYEEPEIIETGADFEGVLESDFEDDGNQDEEGNGRINSRRKVKKAACSMRRFVRAGRIEEDVYELYAYVESDDEGRFNFEGIEEGKYRLNIEYPGVPMDPNSEIEFIVGGDKENQKFTLLATITEDGIVVEAEEVLYSLKPYIKDIKLYPNPTEGVMKADFLVYRKLEDLKMEIMDVRGIKLFEEELDHRMGLHSTKVDLSQYNAGVYFMVFTDDAGTFRQQVKIGKK